MVPAWENLQEVFVILVVVVVVLPRWRFLRFRATFPCHRHSTLASQDREGFHQLWALPWLLSVALLLPGFSVTVLPRVLCFWVGVFYSRAFFTLHSFVCDSDEGRNTPSRILLCSCPHRVVPSGWRVDLNYCCLNYKTIDLKLRQWATKYRVKIKLLHDVFIWSIFNRNIVWRE